MAPALGGGEGRGGGAARSRRGKRRTAPRAGCRSSPPAARRTAASSSAGELAAGPGWRSTRAWSMPGRARSCRKAAPNTLAGRSSAAARPDQPVPVGRLRRASPSARGRDPPRRQRPVVEPVGRAAPQERAVVDVERAASQPSRRPPPRRTAPAPRRRRRGSRRRSISVLIEPTVRPSSGEAPVSGLTTIEPARTPRPAPRRRSGPGPSSRPGRTRSCRTRPEPGPAVSKPTQRSSRGLAARSGGIMPRPFAHPLGGERDGGHDAVVRAAAAEVPGERVGDLGAGGGGLRSSSALAPTRMPEGNSRTGRPADRGTRLLQRMRPLRRPQPLEGGDRAAFEGPDLDGAGGLVLAVDEHRTGAALLRAAAVASAFQVEVVAERIQEGGRRVTRKDAGLAVDGQCDLVSHGRHLSAKGPIGQSRRDP